MADFSYVPCPKCSQKFMVGVEFFRIAEAQCHCPFCHHEFSVYSGQGQARQEPAGKS